MLAKVTSKSLHNAFKSKKQIPPTAQKKFQEKFPQFPFDWKKIYSLPFTVTIETEIREFQRELTAKFYIYKCKLNSKNPSVRVYKAKIGKINQVGMKMAAKRNKLAKQFQKWDKLLPHIGLWDGCRSNNAE